MDNSTKVINLNNRLHTEFPDIINIEKNDEFVVLTDHLRGWTKNFRNTVFEIINQTGINDNTVYKVKYHQYKKEKWQYLKYILQKMQLYIHFIPQ